MRNKYLSVLYKHIIQVENKNVGLKVGGGHKHTIAPPTHTHRHPHRHPQSKKCMYVRMYDGTQNHTHNRKMFLV